ncbi:HAD family hydrolase [Sulfitobacter sp. JB4-11]|uniref:HAD family hydrolase n=1 Tax=Sulfitobacter rhodophyticola TaxID=3238304 RepID=UPI003D814A3F
MMKHRGVLISRPILFDCDGVLVDSEHIYQAVERACLEEIGLVYNRTDYGNRFTGLPEDAFVATLKQDFEARGLGRFPAALPERMNARSRERLQQELTPIADVAGFLGMMTGKRAVASSSGVQTLRWKLTHTDLAGFFGPHVYSGELVARGKPAPDLFLLAADKLGEVPAACIVIEDSLNGVRAGVAAGMEVWGFTGGSHADVTLSHRLREAGASHVFASYAEMGVFAQTDVR